MYFDLILVLWLSGILEQFFPEIKISPLSGCSNKPPICRNVVFPAPDGPTSATVSALLRKKLESERIQILLPPCLKFWDIESHQILDF